MNIIFKAVIFQEFASVQGEVSEYDPDIQETEVEAIIIPDVSLFTDVIILFKISNLIYTYVSFVFKKFQQLLECINILS
jgi:hypothetical protein